MGSKRRLARQLYFNDRNIPRHINMISYAGQLSWFCQKCGEFGPWKERDEHNCEEEGER